MSQHIHILGICGTFMGGLAQLARAAGYRVTGADENVYPPMSTQLEAAGIALYQGYQPDQLDNRPDTVVVGNAMSRGNPVVEAMLDRGLVYTSGPQWLAEQVLQNKWVIAVAGTHGKTTTTAMITTILEHAGLNPGFLVGGVPLDFGVSARLTDSNFFVIEADEYDTAFFDKRSKFVHYRPRTLVINNIEYDHADIFPDLSSIQRQFHHLVRTVPESGLIVANVADENVVTALALGCWTPVTGFGLTQGDWSAAQILSGGRSFAVNHQGLSVGTISWKHTGLHNVQNALAALAVARHIGITATVALEALCQFQGVKRRLELRSSINNISIYDDFAHHPTAIRLTLQGLRGNVGAERILAVFEPRSNTMKMGHYNAQLLASFEHADEVWLYQPAGFDMQADAQRTAKLHLDRSVDSMVQSLRQYARPGDHIVIMSNGGFQGLHEKLMHAIGQQYANG